MDGHFARINKNCPDGLTLPTEIFRMVFPRRAMSSLPMAFEQVDSKQNLVFSLQ